MRVSWKVIYGGALTVVSSVSFYAAALNGGSFATTVVSGVREAMFISLPMILGFIVLFSLLEFVLPAAGARKPLKGYWLNTSLTVLHVFVGAFFGSVVGAGAAVMGKQLGVGWIDLRFTTGNVLLDGALTFLLAMLIRDFFFYWGHRFQHESTIMWQQHKVHHLDEELCAFSTSRHNWLESLAIGPLVSIPTVILFKLSSFQGGVVGALGVAWVAFIHTNIRCHLGLFGVLFNGPQGHRIHHSALAEHHDKNYAAFFPIFDVLFGTYHYPKPGEYPPTGVHDEREVKGLWEAVVLPFRGWRQICSSWRDRRSSDRGGGSTVAIPLEVEKGRTYYWCACGRSKKQPLCDGSHRGTGILPLQYRATGSGTKLFCVCKQTKTPPFCDCSHLKLSHT